jgi:predicted ArsR family transcriptional regulator
MQATREHILRILKERYQATVVELSQELGLTTVTVRHHLEILRGEGLVAAPTERRCKAPGRPKYVYTLAEKASTFFPKRYDHLANLILSEVQSHLSPTAVNQMMKNIGEHIASQATLVEGEDFEARLVAAVKFLNERGYLARWEQCNGGEYLLHITNCPYERVALQHHEVCTVDVTMFTRLLGTSPQRIDWAAENEHQCTYLISPRQETQ